MSSSSDFTSWALLSSSIVGADHQRRGTPIQDYALTKSFGDGAAALVVADGHGGDRHFRSATGARLGCEVLVELIGDILSVSRDPSRALVQLSEDSCSPVLDRWRQRVRVEVSADPFRWDDADLLTSAETIARRDADVAQQWIEALCGETERSDSVRISAYGTTLLGIVVLPSTLWWFQLGDGSLVEVAADGAASLLCEPHSSAIADATPSMSTEGALRYVRTGTRPINGEAPVLLAAVSDGFSNSFEDAAGMMGFFEGALPLAGEYGCDALGDFVPGWLGEMTHAGSGDDITIAWALDRRLEGPR